MYRYVALFRRTESENSASIWRGVCDKFESKDGWTKVYSNQSFVVFEQLDDRSRMHSHALDRSRGIVLGHLFHPKPGNEVVDRSNVVPRLIDELESRRISETLGAHLVEEYWGSYVAFIYNSADNHLRVLRGPTAVLSCFHICREGVSFFFSDPSMFDEFGRGLLEIDWERAALTLKYAFMVSERTPIKNLQALQTGQCLDILRNNEKYTWLWDPIKIANEPKYTTPETAALAIRNAVFACCELWSRLYPNSLLHLSGGLDSSLLAGCLAKVADHSSTVCLSFHNRSTYVDERPFARATAEKFNYRLYEVELRPETIDLDCYLNMRKLHWPYEPTYEAERGLADAEIAERHGLDAWMAGNGGDGVFFAYKDNLAALDYALNNPINRSFVSYALGAARLSDTTIWVTLSRMFAAKFLGKIKTTEEDRSAEDSWAINPDLWNSGALNIPSTPWKDEKVSLLPGKRRQLLGSIASRSYFTVLEKSHLLEPIDPFVSQPIIEACLGVPTYILQYGGHDRRLVRDVFADCLVDQVRFRRFKSNFSPYSEDIIKCQAKFLKELVLDGILVKKGLLDSKVLEAALNKEEEMSSMQYVKLESYAGVEAWARTWA